MARPDIPDIVDRLKYAREELLLEGESDYEDFDYGGFSDVSAFDGDDFSPTVSSQEFLTAEEMRQAIENEIRGRVPEHNLARALQDYGRLLGGPGSVVYEFMDHWYETTFRDVQAMASGYGEAISNRLGYPAPHMWSGELWAGLGSEPVKHLGGGAYEFSVSCFSRDYFFIATGKRPDVGTLIRIPLAYYLHPASTEPFNAKEMRRALKRGFVIRRIVTPPDGSKRDFIRDIMKLVYDNMQEAFHLSVQADVNTLLTLNPDLAE